MRQIYKRTVLYSLFLGNAIHIVMKLSGGVTFALFVS